MRNRYHLIAILLLLTTATIAAPLRAQDSDELKMQEEQQAVGGANPLLPKRTQVAFSGSGSATFMPRNLNGSMPGPTPDPSCTPTVTPVGFSIQCLSDPETKSASTCHGSMSFFSFDETRNVTGAVTALPGGAYSLKLDSGDDDIQGCELNNIPPVSASLGNVITMPGCALNIAGCAGEVAGAGGDHALTTSASVVLTPSD